MRVSALQRALDPVEACVTTVTGLWLLAFVCAGYVVWKPLGLVALVVAVVVAAAARRTTARVLFGFCGQHSWRRYLALGAFAAIASVPFSMAFLHTDLQALAVTATANAHWHGPDAADEVLNNLYGARPRWPSYAACQSIQNATSRDLANGCYATVGYLRSWQIPAAIPVMVCLIGLYCGIPLVVARHLSKSSD